MRLSLLTETLSGTDAHRVKEAIHICRHPGENNRENGIEIPEAWMPTIDQWTQQEVSEQQREQRLTETM